MREKEVLEMAYLERNGKVVATHKVTVIAVIKKGSHGNVERFAKEKIESWKKVSLESISFDKDVIKVVVYTSEPTIFSSRTIPVSVRLPRTIESEAGLYLWGPEFKLPEGIELEEKMPEVKAEQILFPKDDDEFVILY